MKLNREQFLAAAMMINAATGIGCSKSNQEAAPESISADGTPVNGVNGATQSPNQKGVVIVPNQKALTPPALQAGLRSPTGEGVVVGSPVKESGVWGGPGAPNAEVPTGAWGGPGSPVQEPGVVAPPQGTGVAVPVTPVGTIAAPPKATIAAIPVRPPPAKTPIIPPKIIKH